jgi:hypothetical protein
MTEDRPKGPGGRRTTHYPATASQARYGKPTESQPLTALSQTRELASDLGVLVGAPMDPDLHGRTRPDWHGTTDQKVGGSSPSERVNAKGRFRIWNRPLVVSYSSKVQQLRAASCCLAARADHSCRPPGPRRRRAGQARPRPGLASRSVACQLPRRDARRFRRMIASVDEDW